jgi:hypothetical protein
VLSISALTLAQYAGQDIFIQLMGANSTSGAYMMSIQGTPANISVANPTSGSIQVTFPTVTGATTYKLFWVPVAQVGTGYSVVYLSPTTSTYTVMGLQSGVNYRVWAAYVNGSQTFYTQWQTLSTTLGCTGSPAAPTVTKVVGHCARVNVSWPAHPFAIAATTTPTVQSPYRLYWRVAGSTGGYNVVATNNTSFAITNLPLNTSFEYFYRVMCSGGNQIASLIKKDTTCAGPAKLGNPYTGQGGIVEHNGTYLVDVDFVNLATYTDNTVTDGNIHEVNLNAVNELPSAETATVATSTIVAGMNGSFSLIPNPTNGTVLVDYSMQEVGDVMIRITDIQGKVVKEELISNSAKTGAQVFALSEMNSGVYLVNVKAAGYTETKRLVVAK